MEYEEFLRTKSVISEPAGFEPPEELNPMMFPFQRETTLWSLRRGRSAIFADCGLGKSICELEWANQVSKYTKGNVILLTPIAVGPQMIREGKKFGINATICRSKNDIKPGINVTNYEKLHLFNPNDFSGIVLDESSILKAFEGSTRKQIVDFSRNIPYRLAATATPSPNELLEITNHSDFLDVLKGKEIIALFFTQDGNTTHKWRLKGHAKEAFWRWMASWSVAIRKPSDLGYSDEGFILPPLNIHPIVVESKPLPGEMFPREASGLSESRAARRMSLDDRVSKCAEIVNSSPGPWVCWCDLNDESDSLRQSIKGSVEIRGSMSEDQKERAIAGFLDGSIRVIISKPSITGHGLNFQHCHQTAYVGLSYSFELYYQSMRRFWRFGQKSPVEVYIITSESEGRVVDAIKRKEEQAAEMFDNIVRHMAGFSLGRSGHDLLEYNPEKEMRLPLWMPNPKDPWQAHRVPRPVSLEKQ